MVTRRRGILLIRQEFVQFGLLGRVGLEVDGNMTQHGSAGLPYRPWTHRSVDVSSQATVFALSIMPAIDRFEQMRLVG